MNGLRFNRLILVSDSTRSANQFTFPKRLNLITGNDNSIGKSSIVMNIFWALGCSPYFDDHWKKLNVKAALFFSIDGKEYISTRAGDSITITDNDGAQHKFTKITGEYSRYIAELFGFKLRLAARSGVEIETPPPSFFFLPFYIDQRKSWSEPWNSFDFLGQYANWKRSLIKYFCGYYTPEHFDIEEEVFNEKVIISEAEDEVKKIDSALEVLDSVSLSTESDAPKLALSVQEFNDIQSEIEEELTFFTHSQADALEHQATLLAEIYDVEKEIEVAKASVSELSKDYAFSVESVINDELECPMCGTIHDNSLASRSSILADKVTMQDQIHELENALNAKKVELEEVETILDVIESEITRINNKYLRSESHESNFSYVLNQIAQKNVESEVVKKKDTHQLTSKKAEERKSELKKKQKKLLSKEETNALNDFFISTLEEQCTVLGAKKVELDGVKGPSDYKKIIGGGAAEATRSLLAYQLTIVKMIAHVQSCKLSPFVIDTPNQQDQAYHHYTNIINVLQDNIPKNTQVIICAMEHPALTSLAEEAHVIKLDDPMLLRTEDYASLSAEFEILRHHQDLSS
ncbi:hypothetical protein [Vibrio alginolyticus]|uniref:hypothetical protein n=1 Tax=Vibrio alginolyticus TaxID=663 RepID=UPI00215BD57A|nr:hypothetical protein [Vibrio alginolyticus]MCR9537262.1 hypothetical protein [Vibrio alginolyticus]